MSKKNLEQLYLEEHSLLDQLKLVQLEIKMQTDSEFKAKVLDPIEWHPNRLALIIGA